jgi:S-ribosylhomocysteine lyase LuxS involved in autoinducer biosynthesis
MLTFEDCLGLSELTEDEILAIAEHEHIPELAALEMGNYMTHTLQGEREIKRFILDDIALARRAHDIEHAAVLKLVLRHYCQEHHV